MGPRIWTLLGKDFVISRSSSSVADPADAVPPTEALSRTPGGGVGDVISN